MTPNIPLVAWDPDGDPTRPGVLVEVENLVPNARGFVSDLNTGLFNGVVLPSKCYGGDTVTLPSGDRALLLATSSDVYAYTRVLPLTLRSRTSGGAYTQVNWPGTGWRFAQFGEQTLAIQRDNVLQATSNIGTTNFANVSGAPSAYTICVASNFVMVANTDDAPAANTFRFADAWWCSALGSHSDWTPSLATQCDRGRLRETPGPILRLFAYGPDVLAFKKNSIIRGRYVNRPADGIIWQWTTITSEIGIVGHDAVCQVGGIVYFLSDDGVYAFNGSTLRQIDSFPRMWFTRQIANILSPSDAFLGLTQAVYDQKRGVIRWHFVEDIYDQQFYAWKGGCLTYHVNSDRWGYSPMHACDWALRLPDGISFFVDSGTFGNGLQESLDAQESAVVAGFVSALNRQVRTYILATVNAVAITGDIGDDETVIAGTRARLRFLRSPAACTATHFHRMNLGDNPTTGETSTRTDGKFDFSHSARWHRLRFDITGPFEINGMRFEGAPAAKR